MNFLSLIFDVKEYLEQKPRGVAPFPNIQLPCNLLCNLLRKIIDGKSLKIFQEDFYDRVLFSKYTNLVFRLKLCYKENSPQIRFGIYTKI